jgi:putative ABC transport system substrate-binding protein
VGAGPLFVSLRDRIIAFAAQHAIPAVYDWPDYTAAGGLVSYGPNLKEAIRLVGVYTGRILGGARPADLPVQQPTVSNLCSTSERPWRSASPCPRRCSIAPTR